MTYGSILNKFVVSSKACVHLGWYTGEGGTKTKLKQKTNENRTLAMVCQYNKLKHCKFILWLCGNILTKLRDNKFLCVKCHDL